MVAGVAVLGLFFNPFFNWDGFLIWQLLVMSGVQTGGLVAALLAARARGCGLAFADAGEGWKGSDGSTQALRFSIFDMLVFTAAAALLFAALRVAADGPGDGRFRSEHRRRIWHSARGLTVLWACFGSGPVFVRAAAWFLSPRRAA